MPDSYSIGEVAKAVGVHVETVRYYERLRLLNQPARPYGRMRKYGTAELTRLRFIKRSQAAGFSLAEIEMLIRVQHRQACKQTRQLAAEKLASVEKRLRQLRDLRKELRRWVAECDANQNQDCCPALAELGGRPDMEVAKNR